MEFETERSKECSRTRWPLKENKMTLSNEALLCTSGREERDEGRPQTRTFSDVKGQNSAVFMSQTKSKGKSGSSISRESVVLQRPTTRENVCQRVRRTLLHKKGVLFYIHIRFLSVVDVFMCCVGFQGAFCNTTITGLLKWLFQRFIKGRDKY